MRRYLSLLLLLSFIVSQWTGPSLKADAATNNSTTVSLNFGAAANQIVDGKAYFATSTLSVKVPYNSSRTIKSYSYTINGVTKTSGATLSGGYLSFTAAGNAAKVEGIGSSNPGYALERSEDGKGWVVGKNYSGVYKTFKFKPQSGTGCMQGGITTCPGLIPSTGVQVTYPNGNYTETSVTMPSDLRSSEGWALSSSDDVPPVEKMYLGTFDSGKRIPWTSIETCSTTITGATPITSGLQLISFGKGQCGKGKLEGKRNLNIQGILGEDYTEGADRYKYKLSRNYYMQFRTTWEAKTYAYQGSVTINYEPPAQQPNFSGDFDILPDSTLTYGDTFKLHPKDIETVGSCTFQSIKFRIERNGQVYSGNAITSKTTDDVYTLAKYPFVIAAGASHEVYMQLNTSCGSDWIGPKELYLMDPGSGGGPSPTPTPTPTPGENHPPTATIAWVKPGTTTPLGLVAVGSKADLVITSLNDPDYPDDWVEVEHWDFTNSTDWLKTVPDGFGGNIKLGSYNNITASEIGAHKVALTVQDSKGATYTAYATLNVVDSKPVAIIQGPSTVKEGRPLPREFDGSLSYSPLGLKIVDYVWTNVQTKYMTPGTETITLKVKDEENRWSDIASKSLIVQPDEPPIDTLSVPEQGTRLGSVTIRSEAYSPDYDNIVSHKIEMKYDAANNGFTDDSWQTVVSGNGDADSYKFTPVRVGKYLFRETVCEDYGRCGNTDGQAEAKRTLNVTNIAPVADVKTDSELSDSPESTPILMSDLYNNGRFFNLTSGAIGDKSNWKLENGVLKSKVRTQLANVAESYSPLMSYYQDNGTYLYYEKPGPSKNLSGLSFGATTYGFENPASIPFASLQSQPTTTRISLPATGDVIGWTEDEKYTYVTTVTAREPNFNTAISYNLYALNKDFTVKWVKPYSYIPFTFGISNYSGHSHPGIDMRILVHHGRVYTMFNNNNITYIVANNRDTGDEVARKNFTGVIYYQDIMMGISDGIMVGTQKFDFDLNFLGDFLPSDTTGIYSVSQKGIIQTKSYAGSYFRRTTDMALLSGPYTMASSGYTNMNGVFPMSYDNNGNLVGYMDGYDSQPNSSGARPRYRQNVRTTPTGLQTLGNKYYPMEWSVLGLDSLEHYWYTAKDSWNPEYSLSPYVGVYDFQGNLLKRFTPFGSGNAYNNYTILNMYQGTDGLITLWGLDKEYDGFYGAYAVIDPVTLNVILTGKTGLISAYYVPTFIHPHDDQSFVIEWRDRYGTDFYLVRTTAPLSRPKLIDVGDATPDLITGSQVSATQTLKASLKAAAPDGKGTGIAFRIRDDRNYYSVEWEANELRVKKTVNGNASVVWTKGYPMVANQVYDVKIMPNGNTFDLYVNRIWQTTITEAAWTDGKFGIINRGQQDVSFLGASVEAAPAAYGKIEGIALVGQQVNYTLSYQDEENDPQLAAGSTWVYNHNPNVFLQPQGTAAFSGQTLGSPVATFTLPGDYSFTYKAKDDPQPLHRYPDNAFDAYRQPSNAVTGKIRVHRRPIADFTVTWNSNGTLTYTDASYDPDRYNPTSGSYSTENTGINYQTTRGIMEYRYRYHAAGSTTYIEQKPTKLFGGTYVIELSVRDEYNAWSEWATQTIVAGGSTPLPPNPGFTVTPTTQYRFTNVTFNSTASDPQDGARENIEHAYYIKNLTTGGPETLQSDSRTSWTKPFSSLGTFQVRQVVINSYGLYADTTRNVTIVNRKPVVAISQPTGTSAAAPMKYVTLRPQIMWTYSDADGDTQARYQLHFYKSDGSFYRDSTELSGDALTWTPNADFADNTTYYVYVRAYDGIEWSDWGGPRYFRIETNKPPTAELTWTPNPVWEGDQIVLLPAVADPDGDSLDLTYEVESPSGTKQTFRERRVKPYAGAGPAFVADKPGNWKVKLSVSDSKAPAVTVAKTIAVAPLGVSGRVLHTAAWEENRQRYNADHPGKERPANWFWAGERFVLEATVTDTGGGSATKAASVSAEAGPKLKAALQAANPGRPVEWKGELGGEQYGGSLADLPEGEYSFVFTATYTNGVVKKATVVIRIAGDVNGYITVHRIQ